MRSPNTPKNKLTGEDRALRNKARQEIIDAANRHCAQSKFTMRRVQQAVRVVRHHGLIDDRTLAIAGYGSRKAAA